MVSGIKNRPGFSFEWLFTSGGRYFVMAVLAAVLITSVVLLLSQHRAQLTFKTDAKTEAHLAECEGCRNRAVNLIWNHIPASQDRVALLQSHPEQCASCRQKIKNLVHEHTQLQSPLGNKPRMGVPGPSSK